MVLLESIDHRVLKERAKLITEQPFLRTAIKLLAIVVFVFLARI